MSNWPHLFASGFDFGMRKEKNIFVLKLTKNVETLDFIHGLNGKEFNKRLFSTRTVQDIKESINTLTKVK